MYFSSTVNHVVVENFALSMLGSSKIKNEETSRQSTGPYAGVFRRRPTHLPATVRRVPLKYNPSYTDFKVYLSHFYSFVTNSNYVIIFSNTFQSSAYD